MIYNQNKSVFLCKLLNCVQCTQAVNFTTSRIFKYLRIGKQIISNLQAGVEFRDTLEYLHHIDMHVFGCMQTTGIANKYF